MMYVNIIYGKVNSIFSRASVNQLDSQGIFIKYLEVQLNQNTWEQAPLELKYFIVGSNEGKEC